MNSNEPIIKNAIATDETTAYISPVAHVTTTVPSWARWWRQVMFVPFLHNRWLTPEGQKRLNQAISAAEQGHRGEVMLVIENHLPLESARNHCSRDRAIEVFGDHRVWDTADNTGILVYLNLCEHRLEIIADRGINSQVMPSVWQAMCDKALEGITAKREITSLIDLLTDIGQLLRQQYQLNDDPNGNELPDRVVYLR